MKLVTGGSGVIGRALVKKIIEQGETVRVYDLTPPPIKDPNIEFIQGDIKDPNKVIDACKGVDTIFHLAGKMPQARLDEKGFWEINVGGTVNLAKAGVKNNVKRFLFASTIEVYGPQRIYKPLTEEDKKVFTGHYSRNKLECEKLLLKYQKKYGMESTFLRIPMVLGPGFYHEKSTLALFLFIRYGLPIPVPFADIPVCYVSSSDLADAFLLAEKSPDAVGEAFNIAAADYPNAKKFFQDLIKSVNSTSKVIIPPRGFVESALKLVKKVSNMMYKSVTPSELMDFVLYGGAYSIEKAKRVLGYKPKKSVVQSWKECYLWYFSQDFNTRRDILLRQRV
ncbi:MAG: NAD-dependent epimerase/dehydratase family protein [Candidatus Helarchaeota archaeon]